MSRNVTTRRKFFADPSHTVERGAASKFPNSAAAFHEYPEETAQKILHVVPTGIRRCRRIDAEVSPSTG